MSKRASMDPQVVLDAIFVPVMTRLLRYHEDVPPATAEAFVDLALAGAKRAGTHASGRDA